MLAEWMEELSPWLDQPWARPVLIIVGSLAAAFVAERLVAGVLAAAARRTTTEIDDVIIAAIRRPIFVSVILLGLSMLTKELDLGGATAPVSALETIAVLVWAGAAFRVSHEVLQFLAQKAGGFGFFQPRTIPVFDMLLKTGVIAGAVYFIFLAWEIDVTAWLASAGIVGIAVGFAAKDTLANLFAGLFIVADSPYKIGDFIVLDGALDGAPLRGEVTRIGMRSSRILTQDDLEITVPNALIGNSKIINETGGPSPKQRSRVTVGVAYGSDAAQVVQVLLGCVQGIDGICDKPGPEVRLRGFGDSSLNFELLFWIDSPKRREPIRSQVNFKVYEALKTANISIPFPQRDVWLKEMPSSTPPRGDAP